MIWGANTADCCPVRDIIPKIANGRDSHGWGRDDASETDRYGRIHMVCLTSHPPKQWSMRTAAETRPEMPGSAIDTIFGRLVQ